MRKESEDRRGKMKEKTEENNKSRMEKKGRKTEEKRLEAGESKQAANKKADFAKS
jgi:hypothetical protein